MSRLRKALIWIVAVLVGLTLLAALLAPYLLAEIFALERRGQPRVLEQTEKAELRDGYWSIAEIAPGVFAIGEPLYYQNNWSYLITGRDRAVLFDTGPGVEDISAVVAELTQRPVHAMPSHLHFDHVGGLPAFDQIFMLDTPAVRAGAAEHVDLSRYQHLGFVDGITADRIPVSQWIKSGGTFDLGDRELTILAAPGHTAGSTVLIDPVNNLMFTGDFLYDGPLYAMLPGSSRSDYLESAISLLAQATADVRIFGAHAPGQTTSPPVLPRAALERLRDQLAAAESGALDYEGVLPRQLPIDEDITFLTGFPWNNR